MFGGRVLRRILGHKEEEVTEGGPRCIRTIGAGTQMLINQTEGGENCTG
jgi:hypothetical protein